jgi:hypothetical protein
VPLPNELTINAYTGAPSAPRSPLDTVLAQRFAFGPRVAAYQPTLAPPPPADLADWAHPDVGWSLVLPTVSGWNDAQLALPTDQPPCIQQLWEARGRPDLLRYDPAWIQRHSLIHKPKIGAPIALAGAPRGLKPDALPFYLLIVGEPEAIPWDIQYVLNETRAVGRLALTGDALDRYVAALQSGWAGAGCDIRSPFVWAVDHGGTDISRTMCDALAAPVFAKYHLDSDLQAGATMAGGIGQTATAAELLRGLARNPGVVVTTSHGKTGPLVNGRMPREELGWLVDSDHQAIDPAKLIGPWQPDGAIWYAHACCSAGSHSPSRYRGLFGADSPIGKVLDDVATAGSTVAPLPQALLGAARPARAFIGQVEPTFNWTLQHPANLQYLTNDLQNCLYGGIYSAKPPKPVGLAFREHYQRVLGLAAEYALNLALFNGGAPGSPETLVLYAQLAMCDIRSMVILGDPTVSLPGL